MGSPDPASVTLPLTTVCEWTNPGKLRIKKRIIKIFGESAPLFVMFTAGFYDYLLNFLIAF
jgi:hypothetical protein